MGVIPLANEVLVALIGLGGSAIGSLIGILTSSKLTQYRLEQLEKKVQAHNNLVERMYRIEDVAHVYEEKMKVVNHRIEDIERTIEHEH